MVPLASPKNMAHKAEIFFNSSSALPLQPVFQPDLKAAARAAGRFSPLGPVGMKPLKRIDDLFGTLDKRIFRRLEDALRGHSPDKRGVGFSFSKPIDPTVDFAEQIPQSLFVSVHARGLLLCAKHSVLRPRPGESY